MGCRLTLGLVAGLMLVTDLAYAELEEIVVTARKREEKLQDLPMSVTALDADTMARLGVNNLADVTRYAAGVKLDNGFGLNDQRLVIRGLSPSRGRPNSAIIVDGIDLTTESVSTPGGSIYFNSRLLDIERVEVVKGPQSALYGRAAFAGAVQYVSKDPGDELESEVGVDVGEDGRRYYRGAVSGPVTDELGLRVNALSWEEDGFYNEEFTGANLGGGDGYGISLTAKWEPTDNFSARARFAYSEDDFDQQATFYDPFNTRIRPPDSWFALQGDDVNPNTYVGIFGGTPPDADGRKPILSPNPLNPSSNPADWDAYPGGELDARNSSLKLDWDVGPGTITSYTGYVNGDSNQRFDGDFDVRPNDARTVDLARGGTEIWFDTDSRLFSQELRFASNLDGPLQYTVGLLYWDEKIDQKELALSALAFPFGPDGADPGYFNLVAGTAARQANNVSRDTNSQSIYGLVEWDFAEQWKLSFEGRFAREDMDVIGTGCDPRQTLAVLRCNFSTSDLAAEFPPGSGMFSQLDRVFTEDSNTDRYFAPKAIIEWKPADDLLWYFSIAQGVKPGGISTIASGTWMDQNPFTDDDRTELDPNRNLDELKFEEETLTSYELGGKSTLFDRRLILNGAVFFQDYDDKQVPIQTISNNFTFSSIINAGEAEVWGLELESIWLVTDTIRLQAGYSYLDGEYKTLEYTTNSTNSIARAGNCVPDAATGFCTINLNGNTMEDIPEHALVLLAGWYPSLWDSGLSGLLEADVDWQDERYTDEFNDRKVDSYYTVNMRAGVQSDRWDALIYVNNLFDDDTIQSWSSGIALVATAERTDPNLTAFPAEGFSIAPPPRQWGFRANVRF
jgi:outer membrane receptor protein involved in Fe transport